MSKIICNIIDYVFADKVSIFAHDIVELKAGCSWTSLPVREKPTCSSEVSTSDAGPVKKDSVTVVTKYDADVFLKNHTAWGVILRMRTDDKTFYVGSDRFPCMTEVSGDNINDTYTFNATSIA